MLSKILGFIVGNKTMLLIGGAILAVVISTTAAWAYFKGKTNGMEEVREQYAASLEKVHGNYKTAIEDRDQRWITRIDNLESDFNEAIAIIEKDRQRERQLQLNLEEITNEVQGLRIEIERADVGGCSFNADADSLLDSAFGIGGGSRAHNAGSSGTGSSQEDSPE